MTIKRIWGYSPRLMPIGNLQSILNPPFKETSVKSTSTVRRAAFRTMVDFRQGFLVPGAFNAMSARVIQDSGFKACYITGAGVTNMSLGLPSRMYGSFNTTEGVSCCDARSSSISPLITPSDCRDSALRSNSIDWTRSCNWRDDHRSKRHSSI